MSKRRILYIEDDPSILTGVQTLLESRLPVAVDPCMTAGGAELLLNRYCYDLVISDIGLPVVDGIQIIERVLQRDPGQPVMLFSEYDSDETRSQAARIGVPIIPKFSSISIVEFVDMVSGLIEKRPCPEAATEAERSPNLLAPLKLMIESELKARAALQVMGCTVNGKCSLHEECLQRARFFSPPVVAAARIAVSSHRLAVFLLLCFPWL